MNNIVVEVVPMFFEIQGKVMMEYGYAPDDEGFGAFGESLKTNEGSDEEYDKLAVRPTTVVSNFFLLVVLNLFLLTIQTGSNESIHEEDDHTRHAC